MEPVYIVREYVNHDERCEPYEMKGVPEAFGTDNLTRLGYRSLETIDGIMVCEVMGTGSPMCGGNVRVCTCDGTIYEAEERQLWSGGDLFERTYKLVRRE